MFEKLSEHPWYIEDWDDDFDCTYATIAFFVPHKFRAAVDQLVAENPDAVPPSPRERFEAFMAKLQNEPEDPDVRRVMKAVEPIIKAIAEKAK